MSCAECRLRGRPRRSTPGSGPVTRAMPPSAAASGWGWWVRRSRRRRCPRRNGRKRANAPSPAAETGLRSLGPRHLHFLQPRCWRFVAGHSDRWRAGRCRTGPTALRRHLSTAGLVRRTRARRLPLSLWRRQGRRGDCLLRPPAPRRRELLYAAFSPDPRGGRHGGRARRRPDHAAAGAGCVAKAHDHDHRPTCRARRGASVLQQRKEQTWYARDATSPIG